MKCILRKGDDINDWVTLGLDVTSIYVEGDEVVMEVRAIADRHKNLSVEDAMCAIWATV